MEVAGYVGILVGIASREEADDGGTIASLIDCGVPKARILISFLRVCGFIEFRLKTGSLIRTILLITLKEICSHFWTFLDIWILH
jgi:hypothetical protein